jgi:hypothetical protein
LLGERWDALDLPGPGIAVDTETEPSAVVGDAIVSELRRVMETWR